MRVRLTNSIQVLLICAGLACAFGPHLLILGYKAAGGTPPAALRFFCILHQGSATGKTAALAGWSNTPTTAGR